MCLCRNARQCVCFRQKKRGLSIASRWLYTYINEQFLHDLAILVCLFVVPEWFLPLYLQSNRSSVMPLSLAFNFSPWICIHSSSPFYWYMSQRWTWDMDHRNNLPLLTVVMCVLCWCDYAAAAWWVLLGQKRACYYILLILKEMKSCQQLKISISFLGIINICSQYLIFFSSFFTQG